MLLNASGCLDALSAPEVARQLDAFVTKTVTPLARPGNPPTRIVETDHGMLNSIGLANPGRERFLAESLPRLRELVPDAQLAWEAPMACGYGACYGCAVEIDGEWKRLCVEGPVLAA